LAVGDAPPALALVAEQNAVGVELLEYTKVAGSPDLEDRARGRTEANDLLQRKCARAGWMMELAADRVMAIVPG
jgi:hypothetical protein